MRLILIAADCGRFSICYTSPSQRAAQVGCCGLRPLLDLLHSRIDASRSQIPLRIAAASRFATLSRASPATSHVLRIAAASRFATLHHRMSAFRVTLRIAAASRFATLDAGCGSLDSRLRIAAASRFATLEARFMLVVERCGLRPLLDLLHCRISAR